MKTAELVEGVTYHNGKGGPRSYSARKLLKLDPQRGLVVYKQVAGRYKGTLGVITADSFASWCKGVVAE